METPARSSRAHRLNRGPPYFQSWSLSAVTIVLVVVTMLCGRAVGGLIETGDNGDLINRSGLVMSTTDGTRTYSVPINQLPLDANRDQANTRVRYKHYIRSAWERRVRERVKLWMYFICICYLVVCFVWVGDAGYGNMNMEI